MIYHPIGSNSKELCGSDEIVQNMRQYFVGLCEDLKVSFYDPSIIDFEVIVSSHLDYFSNRNEVKVLVLMSCAKRDFHRYESMVFCRLAEKANSIQGSLPYLKIMLELKHENNKEESNMSIPEVIEIVHRTSNRGEFFTVKWADNTTTTVKLMEGDTSDEYTAFLFALGKKVFGDRGVARKFIHEKKKVFEDRVEVKAAEKKRQRAIQAIQQSVSADFENNREGIEIAQAVYEMGFVPPAFVSRSIFKKNGR